MLGHRQEALAAAAAGEAPQQQGRDRRGSSIWMDSIVSMVTSLRGMLDGTDHSSERTRASHGDVELGPPPSGPAPPSGTEVVSRRSRTLALCSLHPCSSACPPLHAHQLRGPQRLPLNHVAGHAVSFSLSSDDRLPRLWTAPIRPKPPSPLPQETRTARRTARRTAMATTSMSSWSPGATPQRRW